MIDEHEYIKRMLKVMRKSCFRVIKERYINYEDFYKMVDFVKYYADGHHHNKEEVMLFNRMIENLGPAGEKVIKHGMLVEHDLGRLYITNLKEALKKMSDGDDESVLDVIGNVIAYTDLLQRHIDKENNVVYRFAENNLDKQLLDKIDEECLKYEDENLDVKDKYISILEELEIKYL